MLLGHVCVVFENCLFQSLVHFESCWFLLLGGFEEFSLYSRMRLYQKHDWQIFSPSYRLPFSSVEVSFSHLWMELERIMLSEISQAEKDNYHMISLI